MKRQKGNVKKQHKESSQENFTVINPNLENKDSKNECDSEKKVCCMTYSKIAQSGHIV